MDFINKLNSLSLYPRITKPSRITANSDNIFSNDLTNNFNSGLLTCDISDHLPIFTIYSGWDQLKMEVKQESFIRLHSDDALQSLREAFMAQDWELVLCEQDVNNAYDFFFYKYSQPNMINTVLFTVIITLKSKRYVHG